MIIDDSARIWCLNVKFPGGIRTQGTKIAKLFSKFERGVTYLRSFKLKYYGEFLPPAPLLLTLYGIMIIVE